MNIKIGVPITDTRRVKSPLIDSKKLWSFAVIYLTYDILVLIDHFENYIRHL